MLIRQRPIWINFRLATSCTILMLELCRRASVIPAATTEYARQSGAYLELPGERVQRSGSSSRCGRTMIQFSVAAIAPFLSSKYRWPIAMPTDRFVNGLDHSQMRSQSPRKTFCSDRRNESTRRSSQTMLSRVKKNLNELCKNTSSLASRLRAFNLCIDYIIHTTIIDLAQLLRPMFALHCLRFRHLV